MSHTVTYQSLEEPTHSGSVTVRVDESKYSAVIEGLMHSRSYMLGVAASTRAGTSPFAYEYLAAVENSEFTEFYEKL